MKKKVLILGATSAIAEATGRIYASRAAKLFLVARDQKKIDLVAQNYSMLGASQVDFLIADFIDYNSHQMIYKRAKEKLKNIDIVIIAYGKLGNQNRGEKIFDEAREVIETNFTSVVSLLTIIANDFQIQQSGIIAVLSSPAGDRGRAQNYIYGATKGGLSVFLSGLRARLYQHNVSVITVKPGFVETPMTRDVGRNCLFSSPQKIAKLLFHKIEKNNCEEIYLPWFWKYILIVIKLIPHRFFKKFKL